LKIIILFIVSVHAFLQDEDYVLDQIDTTKAEEKCLMLIKKPRSSSKISVILWQSVLLVEETGVFRENHRPAASH
jgi:hypothetical protein